MKRIEKVTNHLKENLIYLSEEFIDFDEAIIGYCNIDGHNRVVYSRNTILKNMKESLPENDELNTDEINLEYYEFNIASAYMGVNGPTYVLVFENIESDMEMICNSSDDDELRRLSEKYNSAIVGLNEGIHQEYTFDIMYSHKALKKFDDYNYEIFSKKCAIIVDDII